MGIDNSDGDKLKIFNDSNFDASTAIATFDRSTNNVGIGIEAPSATFEVSGTSKFSAGDMTLSN